MSIWGARAHNLKNIDLQIPTNKLVVFTGLSGSGKSSLAFDTLFAEGQRRYMDTLSAYARQFIGNNPRPEVDKIEGLSPVVAIEQKTVSKNPRSTVGTLTEVYDFLRLLFARSAKAYSLKTGKPLVSYSEDQVFEKVQEKYLNHKILILAPLVRSRKGHYKELFETLQRQGFSKVRIDGSIERIESGLKLDRYKVHDIELVVDRYEPGNAGTQRLRESLKLAFKLGKGTLIINPVGSTELSYYSKNLMDPDTGESIDEPQPNTFSFNSPYGACTHCKGLGVTHEMKPELIIPDPTLSIARGGILPLGELRDNFIFSTLKALAKHFQFSLTKSIQSLTKEQLNIVLYGCKEEIKVEYVNYEGKRIKVFTEFKGIVNTIQDQFYEGKNDSLSKWAEEFMQPIPCPQCNGSRLKPEALAFKMANQNIAELSFMSIGNLYEWISNVETQLDARQKEIGSEILKEIRERLGFLVNVGLDYLSLNNKASTLSGGEAQRIRLATQIGSGLVHVLYILDEPSIGLHQRDNQKLIQSLLNLRDLGNSVVVVEHDMDMIQAADFIVDMGPGAGINGGQIAACGSLKQVAASNSPTGLYLSGKKSIPVPQKRRKGNGKKLQIQGCSGNNLKNIDLTIPLNTLVCITGVSGSGKSTLINETLYPAVMNALFGSTRKPQPYKQLKGLKHIDKVIRIDQNPIGRTPRSNPATYTGVFTEIRQLFVMLPEAQIRGYKPGRFSFNVKGGRCEECKGGGYKSIEMNFLPDVEVLCQGCLGKRYNRETLQVKYKGKSISDVLNMSIEEAIPFFENIPNIHRKLSMIQRVGLGYIKLGQSSTTLSGGEAQRVKLAEELSKKDTGSTLYLLDEPTTGLHFDDIQMLLNVLQELTQKGNTVLVIEHNMDVIKCADYIIDMGPEGGAKGGQILATGTPEELCQIKESHTAHFLKSELTM